MEGATALETILTSVTSFVTAVIGWIGDFLETIVSNPLLLIFVVLLPLAGVAIGYIRRLIRL